ncbi:GNAT family N-acetyltransferase [Planomicrobium sp. MB-3u-38]|uniref:GNAT family N-acetyltransferase n=1 Tax=Planomicrobium sp. MB-3u-38 TaxID=2058318 RepID=UPI001E65C78A|nr:GNAT family N-acetyltransferase [Planomicrobium sp. MB-3u-38]
MSIQYRSFTKLEPGELLDGLVSLHTEVFGSSDDLAGRMAEKPKLHIDLALDDERVIGYKIGYALNREQFYSWLGGVDERYRHQGIARELMERQHEYARDESYNAVRTHTKNKWRSMLLLNIQSGFDVIGTYTDDTGESKIILEKKL